MANVVIDIAAEYTGNRAFKQAETATEKLQKSVKNLAKTLGLAFSTAAIVNYGKLAVQASLEAQAQQQRLAALLKVTNGATQDQVNILHEQAAALEQIGVVTGGNITQVQSQLATFDLQLATIKTLTPAILDYVVAEKGAAASAADFKSMTNGLAQALNGNFASLTRTGFVLDETTKNLIKNGTEAERAAALVTVLNSTYKDFNKNLRNTPMGQFQVLANSAEQAKEIIGTDLLAAMQLVAGEDGIAGAADAMERFATQVGNAIYGVGVLIDKIKSIPGITTLLELLALSVKYSPAAGLSALGAASKARSAGTPAQSPGQRMAIDRANKEALKLQKSKNDLSKIDNANTTRKLALSGDELALKELEKKFDVERVGLYSALNQATDGETRMRLLSLIAIHDQNTALAGMIKKANETGNAFESITDVLRLMVRSMLDTIAGPLAALQKAINFTPSSGGGFSNMPENAGGINPPNYGALDVPLNAGSFAIGERDTLRAMGIGQTNITINATGIGDQQIATVVQNAIQNLNRYGNSTTYAGAI